MAGQVTYLDHPLIQHKISRLRDKTTGTNEFRSLVEEIAMLMGYEALRDLPTEDVTVETPIEDCIVMRKHMNHMSITANCRIRSKND